LTYSFAGKVWRSCEDCQRLIKKYDEDELCQCDNCLHIFHQDDVVWIPDIEKPAVFDRCYCKSCFSNLEISRKRCCASCIHYNSEESICLEGGYSEIGDPFRERTEEECNAWKPII